MDLDSILNDIMTKGNGSAIISFGSAPQPTLEIKEAFEMLVKKLTDDTKFAEATGKDLYNVSLSTSIPTKSNIYDCKAYFNKLGITLKRGSDYKNEIIGSEYSDEIETKSTRFETNEFNFYIKDDYFYELYIKFDSSNGLCEICSRGFADKFVQGIAKI